MSMEKHKKLVRLYVPVHDGKEAVLSDGQAHYLRNVMRVEAGAQVRAFDGHSGEWIAEVKEINKKKAIISFLDKKIEQKAVPDIQVLASPVKKEAFDIMVEKAAELGAASFQPVVCDHTVVHRMNEERLQAISIEAAEQCERLDIMRVATLAPLKDVLKGWDKSRKLIFCLERGAAEPIAMRLPKGDIKPPLAVLIGPEGGFSDTEVALLSGLDFVVPVSLGPRILRAETALIAALSCIQAQLGDWA